MKKAKNYLQVFLLLLLSAVILIPLVVLGQYDVPFADDYSYGVQTHLAFIETHSVFRTLLAAMRQAKETYTSWQGTFSAVFLMALQPAVFAFEYYSLTPWIMLAALFTGICCLSVGVFHYLFGADRRVAFLSGVIIFHAGMQLLPSPVQGLYWYNGAIYYSFFLGLTMIGFYFLIRLIKTGRLSTSILLCAIYLFLGGGNYVTAMMCFVVNTSVLLILVLERKTAYKKVIVPLAVLTVSFLISIISPGNNVRQAQLQYRPDFFFAFKEAFIQTITFSIKWTSLPVIGMSVFLALTWSCLKPENHRPFRFPGIVSIWSICLLASMFFPPLYAMGNIGEQRLVNILFLSYLLLLSFNLFYWLQWFRKKYIKDYAVPRLRTQIIGAVIFAFCVVVYIVTGHGVTTVSAIGELRSGEARVYYEAARERQNQLEDPDIKEVRLQPFPTAPYLLYIGDIEDNMDSYLNQDMSAFYGKDSILLSVNETGE